MRRATLKSGLLWPALLVLFATAAICGPKTEFLKNYKGTPYEDSRYPSGAQKIPGKVQCAYYDRGGEGIAYHDSDSKNSGSGG
jgi:lipocalin